MICHTPFFVEVDPSQSEKLNMASRAIAREWGRDLITIRTDHSPVHVFENLLTDNCLVHLRGDPAMFRQELKESWIEVLGAWKVPIVLMVPSNKSGEIPGMAASLVALSQAWLVPLIGVLQVGGLWKPALRKMDGLPWCGCLDPNEKIDLKYKYSIISQPQIDELVDLLNKRHNYLCN